MNKPIKCRRGIGTIPGSGWQLREEFKDFDADRKFNIDIKKAEENAECIAGDVMKGVKKPYQCPHFGTKCTPQNPLGAPMVSSEGALTGSNKIIRNML